MLDSVLITTLEVLAAVLGPQVGSLAHLPLMSEATLTRLAVLAGAPPT